MPLRGREEFATLLLWSWSVFFSFFLFSHQTSRDTSFCIYFFPSRFAKAVFDITILIEMSSNVYIYSIYFVNEKEVNDSFQKRDASELL